MYRLDYSPNDTPNQVARFVRPQQSPPIMPGQQTVLHGDLDFETQIQHIITQLERFGLMAEKDIGHLTKSTAYIYNIDRAVNTKSIRAVMDFNSGILTQDGASRRKAAAIAANSALENSALNALEPGPQAFETSIEQLDLVGDEKRLEEGHRIGIDPRNAPPPKSGRRRAA
jgi:hypothetical protein